jgi:hypothetical protein
MYSYALTASLFVFVLASGSSFSSKLSVWHATSLSFLYFLFCCFRAFSLLCPFDHFLLVVVAPWPNVSSPENHRCIYHPLHVNSLSRFFHFCLKTDANLILTALQCHIGGSFTATIFEMANVAKLVRCVSLLCGVGVSVSWLRVVAVVARLVVSWWR